MYDSGIYTHTHIRAKGSNISNLLALVQLKLFISLETLQIQEEKEQKEAKQKV